jgi:hypothetical protein
MPSELEWMLRQLLESDCSRRAVVASAMMRVSPICYSYAPAGAEHLMKLVPETAGCHRLVQKSRDACVFGAVTGVYWHEVPEPPQRGEGVSGLPNWHQSNANEE